MSKNQIVVREYTKDIFPFFNGNGAVLHTVSAVCSNPKTAEIVHSFGKDECLNEYVNLGSLIEANKLLKENPKYKKNSAYLFAVISEDAIAKEFFGREIKGSKNEKRFKVLWQKTFGKTKRATYSWGWLNNLMFSNLVNSEYHQSQVKISYPTKKLVFRAHFEDMYPMEGNPYVIMVDSSGKESKIAESQEIKPFKEKTPFDLTNKIVVKTYKVEIGKPILGNTYKLVWKIGLENMSKYLDWLDAKR